MFDKNKDFNYEIDPNFDFVLEERANTFIALRKIKWGSSDTAKLDIRKYRATEEGEMMMKGCSLSDEGADELTRLLIQEGYGSDKDIYDAIINKRPEITSRFIETIRNSSDKEIEEHLNNHPIPEDESDENMFDLNNIIEE